MGFSLKKAFSGVKDFLSGGVGDVIGGIANTVGSAVFGRENRKDAQADRIWEWNLQNEYNKPSAQMQRLKEAGLNPYLYASSLSGLSSGGISASSPSIPSVDLGIGSAFNHANNWKSRKEQLELERDKYVMNKNIVEKTVLDNDILEEKKKSLQLDNEFKRNQILYNQNKMGLDNKYYELSRDRFNTYQNHLINQDTLANRYYYFETNPDILDKRYKKHFSLGGSFKGIGGNIGFDY